MSRTRTPTRLLATVGAAVLVLSATGMSLATPAHAATGAKLSVLHAVPGLTVDIYVDGKRTLNDFKPGSLAGPLSLPAGTYEVAITAGDAEDASDPAIGPVDLTLEDGGNYTAVAHLQADGDPTATLFDNDVSKTAPGEGRLTVRHTAAAPTVDILAGGEPVVTNLTNPDEKVLDLPAGSLQAAVALEGTTKPVIGPAAVNVAEGTNTIVYAWGRAEDGNLALAVQTVSGLHNAPGGVPAGEAGLAGLPAGTSAPWAMTLVVALAAAVLFARNRVVRVHARG